MRSALIITAVAALGIAPATADAKVFSGKTSQDKKASLHTDPNGIPAIVRIPWVATNCQKANKVFSDATQFKPDGGKATADTVTDSGTYPLRDKGGWRYTVTVVLDGKRAGSGWTGTLKTNAIVRRNGKKVDTCNTTVSWSVKPT